MSIPESITDVTFVEEEITTAAKSAVNVSFDDESYSYEKYDVLRIKVKGLNGKFRRHPEGTWAKETNGTYSRVQDDVEEELEQRFDCSVTMSFYLYIMFS